MSKQVHRNHSVGMNSAHEANILRYVELGDGAGLDFTIRAITGNRRAVRREAEATIGRLLRAGGELPVPDLLY
jgi:hypothetical protein